MSKQVYDQSLEILHSLRNPIFRATPAGVTVFINDCCSALYGIRFRWTEPLNSTKWLDADTAKSLSAFISNASPQQDFQESRSHFESESAGYLTIQWNFVAFFKNDGSLDYVQASGNDITEVAEREDIVKRQSEQFEALFHNSPVPLWREDFTGILDHIDQLRGQGIEDLETFFIENPDEVWKAVSNIRILDVNRATLDSILYCGKDDLLGNLGQTIHQDSLVPFRNEVLALANRERFFNTELPFIRGDGAPLNTLIFMNFPEERELYNDVIVAHVDITELKNTQKALEYAKLEAEQASRAKTVFVSNISHEIRTPLNGIIGFTNLLEQEPLSEKQSEFLNTIKGCSDTLLSLINQVLDLSKIEAVKMEVNTEDFYLNKLLDEIVTVNRLAAERAGTRLDLRIDGNRSDYIRGDRLKVNQIVTNLVRNAVKFCDDGEISVECNLDENKVCIVVKDTGVGIGEEALKTIFNPFSQEDSSDTRAHGGSGLGLSIARDLSQLMEGDLVIESEKGVGTACILTLPYVPAELPVDEVVLNEVRNSDVETSYCGLKALIVDDNRVNIKLLEHVLSPLYVETHACLNGQEAVDYLSRNTCDAVFMDLQMPVMDGYESIRLIRNGGAGASNRKIPIAVVSANILQDERNRVGEMNVSHFVPKPIKLDDLKAFLAYCVHKKGQLPHDTIPR